MDRQQHIRLLIVEDDINVAQEIVNVVRNTGHAVRESRADDMETLLYALEDNQLDIVFSSVHIEGLSLGQVKQSLNRAKLNIPLLALSDTPDLNEAIEVMRAGAAGLVSRENPEFLAMVLDRELANLTVVRRLAEVEEALKESEERCKNLLDSSKDAVAYVLDGMHIFANPVYLELFGVDDIEDIEGMPIMDTVVADDHAKLKDFLSRYGRGDESAKELNLRGVRSDGGRLSITMEFSDATYEDEACTQVVIRDHTAAQQLETQMRDLKVRDPLTGLFNRGHFMEHLTNIIEGEDRNKKGLLYVEVDGFQKIKDGFGMSGSDVVLKGAAQEIQAAIGDMGMVARLNDQAFTVVVPDIKNMKTRMEQTLAAVRQHAFKVDGKALSVTVSVGCSALIDLPNEPMAALDCVEQACADAMASGGDTHRPYRVAGAATSGDEAEEKELAIRVRDAIKENRLKLLFQPIGSLHGDTDENYEVLMRMMTEKGDLISPRHFMGAAIKYRLAPSLDRWVIANALHQLANRIRSGHETRFFVKLCSTTLQDKKFIPWLANRLKISGVPGELLVIEAEEAGVMTHLKESKVLYQQVKALGCGFAIDGFGRNTSALKLLKHLPADFIRIHGELILSMAEDEAVLEQVRTLASSVNGIGKTPIACRVDDAALLPLLFQVGINKIQGEFLQEPQDVLDFEFVGEMA